MLYTHGVKIVFVEYEQYGISHGHMDKGDTHHKEMNLPKDMISDSAQP
jgi:hypothetical protein